MRYVVLAAGFDGTLARDGRCDRRSIAALRAFAASGRKLILVTSRELRDLLDVFPEARLFDYLVAENGAVIHRPAARESAILAPAPSEVLIHELRRRRIEPLSIGSVLVTTAKIHRDTLTEVVERLRLDCYIVDNGDSLAVLPTGVNKASGVDHVLAELDISHHNLVAIGDAENDVALLERAEHSVAVANAVPMLKRLADRVTRAPYGDAVSELVREVVESDLAGAPTRRRIVLGTRGAQHQVTFSPAQCSVLVSGPIASGKAALFRNLLGQYLAQQYQCCVMGVYPAGSFLERDDVVVCGDELTAPRAADVMHSLQQPMQSVVVNIAALRPTARPAFAIELLERLQHLQNDRGRPHLIVFDQVEALLNADAAAICARMKAAALIFLTTQPERVPACVRDEVDIVVALGEPAMTLAHIQDESIERAMQVDSGGLEPGHAVVWVRESGTAPFRVELAINPPAGRTPMAEDEALGANQRAASPQHKNNEAAVP